MNKNVVILSCCILSMTILTGCETAKDSLGLNKAAPDEFAVIKHKPLEVPAGITLPPPRPGVARPQEIAPSDQAHKDLFGVTPDITTRPTSETSDLFLSKAGADNIEPGIRKRVNEESSGIRDESEPVIEKLIKLGRESEPDASIVDAKKEAERLQNNKAQGKSILDGKTPVIED